MRGEGGGGVGQNERCTPQLLLVAVGREDENISTLKLTSPEKLNCRILAHIRAEPDLPVVPIILSMHLLHDDQRNNAAVARELRGAPRPVVIHSVLQHKHLTLRHTARRAKGLSSGHSKGNSSPCSRRERGYTVSCNTSACSTPQLIMHTTWKLHHKLDGLLYRT